MINNLSPGKINRIIFLIYTVCISVLSFFHEFWRDELQSFMIVRGSNSISELLYNTRYEGHPSLWFFMLFGLKFIASGLLPMKILHLGISMFTGWLIIKYSPFTIVQKILLLFGYFFFYEYTFIIRNYSIGLLFIFAFCALFPLRKSPRHFILLALSVVGMMLSNFYSFFIGFSMMIMILSEYFFYYRGKERIAKFLPGYVIMIVGIVLFLLDTNPPPDYGYAHAWNTDFRIGQIVALFTRVYQVFVPVPIPSVHYWNTTIIGNFIYQAFFGILIIATILFVFARKGLSRWFIAMNFIIILVFSYVKFNGSFRHNGHMFIAFVVMMWLQQYLPGKVYGWNKLSKVLFYFVLAIQFVSMLFIVGLEVVYPFSQAKNAAVYIKENHNNNIIVAHEDAGSSPVCAFLDVPFYYPRSDRFGTYIIWNKRRLEQVITTAFVIEKIDSLKHLYKKEVLYLTTVPIDSLERYNLVLQGSFTPSVEPVESYYLYTKR
jgi:hypothetical protein